jgi:NADH-quinone oxidoreductase subunit L
VWTWATVVPFKAIGDGVRRVNRGFVDALDVVGQEVLAFAEDLRPIQTGQLRRYVLAVMVGTVVVLGYFLIRF